MATRAQNRPILSINRWRKSRKIRNFGTLGLVVLGPALALATYLVIGPFDLGATAPTLRLILLADLVYVLVVAALVLAVRRPDPEKISAYECGFNAFDDARMKFDVRFYLVAILFIIFDLEVAFLFPWAVAFKDIGGFGFVSMLVFLAVLTIGFAYEWKKGALEWE